MRAQVLPWPFVRAIHNHRAITTRPTAIASVRSVFRSRTWAAVRPGFALRSAALMPLIRDSEMITATALTAAPAYMSLTAVTTGAGAGGRSGLVAWPVDGCGWFMVTSSSGGSPVGVCGAGGGEASAWPG